MNTKDITTAQVTMKHTRSVGVEFHAESGVLELKDETGETIVRLDNEVIDSGAFVRKLPMGQVVLPLNDSALPDLANALEHAGVLRPIGTAWSTWGGGRFIAAEVIL